MAGTKAIMSTISQTKDSLLKLKYLRWRALRAILLKQKNPQSSDGTDAHARLEEEAEQLEKVLLRNSAIAFPVLWPTTVQIQRKMYDDEVAIEFVRYFYMQQKFYDSALYGAYLLFKNQPAPVFVPLASEAALKAAMVSANDKDRAKTARGVIKLYQRNALATDLYKLIWEPLEPFLSKVTKVSFSAAGDLYHVPFHVLQIDSTRLLMDKYELQKFTTTGEIARRNEQSDTTLFQSAVLFGNPDFNAPIDSTDYLRIPRPT
ncbi:MAG: CHAT domain-containing protein [Chitinophagaceae bacterium]|nr:MAG: CHAT domain-containing protein [Chitinophagaceae bacterium]